VLLFFRFAIFILKYYHLLALPGYFSKPADIFQNH